MNNGGWNELSPRISKNLALWLRCAPFYMGTNFALQNLHFESLITSECQVAFEDIQGDVAIDNESLCVKYWLELSLCRRHLQSTFA